MRSLSGAVRALAVVAVVGVLGVLAVVGVVATVSELQGTWTWYLRMEKVITASTPLALGLAGLTVVAMFGLVAAADR